MLVKDALKTYSEKHLGQLSTGAEREKQLKRILGKYSSRQLHRVTNKDLTDVLDQWDGGTRNRYRSALTHFWKWARSQGHTRLQPTLMPGKEAPRDTYLSLGQLRELYEAADLRGDWAGYRHHEHSEHQVTTLAQMARKGQSLCSAFHQRRIFGQKSPLMAGHVQALWLRRIWGACRSRPDSMRVMGLSRARTEPKQCAASQWSRKPTARLRI